jgi:hypothetical protein
MQLKRARKEGRLAEAMLDRRAKLKRYDLLLILLTIPELTYVSATDFVDLLQCVLY